MALEIMSATAINKGVVIAKCDVHIVPWKIILKDVTIFEKDGKRWPSMPSARWTHEGKTKYKEVVAWADSETRERFREQFLKVWDEYVAAGLLTEPESPKSVSEDEDIPF